MAEISSSTINDNPMKSVDLLTRSMRQFNQCLVAAIPIVRALADAIEQFDPYARAGYPLGKTIRGRKKWLKYRASQSMI